MGAVARLGTGVAGGGGAVELKRLRSAQGRGMSKGRGLDGREKKSPVKKMSMKKAIKELLEKEGWLSESP